MILLPENQLNDPLFLACVHGHATSHRVAGTNVIKGLDGMMVRSNGRKMVRFRRMPASSLSILTASALPSFRSRVELYEMDWIHRDNGQGIGLERYIVATGPLGGMIGERSIFVAYSSYPPSLTPPNCALPHTCQHMSPSPPVVPSHSMCPDTVLSAILPSLPPAHPSHHVQRSHPSHDQPCSETPRWQPGHVSASAGRRLTSSRRLDSLSRRSRCDMSHVPSQSLF